MELALTADPVAWDRAALGPAVATPFHAWSFLDGYASASGLSFEPLLVRVDGRDVGGVPQLVRRRGPARWVGIGSSFSYGGPTAPREVLPQVLCALGRRSRLRTVRERVEIRGVVAADLDVRGWQGRDIDAMVVPLEGRTEAELASAASKKFRQHLGHATRGGVEIRPAGDHDLDVLLPRWLAERFAAQGLRSPFPQAFVRRVVDDFAGRRALRAHAAVVGGETVGVQVSLDHAGRTYPWLIASEPAHERLRVPTALTWHLLAEARAAGLREVDLSGAPNEGIRAFKTAMGAVPRPYAVLVRGLRSGSPTA